MTPEALDGEGRITVSSPNCGHLSGPEQAQLSSEMSPTVRQGSLSSPERSEPPAKRAKRGKYISRACAACQQRKVKCEGGRPCAQCVAKKRLCVSPLGAKQASFDVTGSASSQPQDHPGEPLFSHFSSVEILRRLEDVERRLSVLDAQFHCPVALEGHYQLRQHAVGANRSPSFSAKLDDLLEAKGQTFAGEVWMDFELQHAEEFRPCESDTPQNVTSDLSMERLLPAGENVGDRGMWRHYLSIYFEEVHIMYPFLHPPSVWRTFEELWSRSLCSSDMDSAGQERKRMSTAVLYFCLALGCCSVSKADTSRAGSSLAGWSLYSSGMGLIQEESETNCTTSRSLLTLHLLLLRILYFIRLDATKRAARLIGLLVSDAHLLGLHRSSIYDKLPIFWSETACRTWWCIYLLDRRQSLQSGQPYLIQDSNIEARLPLPLDDSWLSRFSTRAEPAVALGNEVSAELAKARLTAIPYLVAMVRIARVIGKVWMLVYGTNSLSSTFSTSVEYTDMMICKICDSLPKHLAHDPTIAPGIQYNSRPRWQVKQSLLLFTCTTFIRLLVHATQSSKSRLVPRAKSTSHNETTSHCANLATSILSNHEKIQDDGLKYCFPLNHYVTSTAMVSISLVSREPGLKDSHGILILAATQSLATYCRNLWVSDKMAKCVSNLSSMVLEILGSRSSKFGSRHDLLLHIDEQHGHDRKHHFYQRGTEFMPEAPGCTSTLAADTFRSPFGSKPADVQASEEGCLTVMPEPLYGSSVRTVDPSLNIEFSSHDEPLGLHTWALKGFDFENIISGGELSSENVDWLTTAALETSQADVQPPAPSVDCSGDDIWLDDPAQWPWTAFSRLGYQAGASGRRV